MRRFVSLLLFMLLAQPTSSRAENLNVDLGLHYGPPSSSFGAAANRPGVWNDIGLAGTSGALDTSGAVTGVSISVVALTDTGWIGAGGTDAELLVQDNCFASGGSTWSVAFAGLADHLYDVYVYAPAHGSVPSGDLNVGGTPLPDVPGTWAGSFVEGTNYARTQVMVSGGALLVTGDSAGLHGPAGIQLVEVPVAFNIDVGLHWGAPASSFGAAALQPGPWNEIGLGTTTGLFDVLGRPSALSVQLSALTDTGWAGSGGTDAERLMNDNAFVSSGGTWQLTLSQIADGNYWLYLYGPAHPSVDSGALDVNGTLLPAISGDFSGGFVEGTSHVAVPVSVSGGTLTISGQNPASLAGVAGLQLRTGPLPVPALGPAGSAALILLLALAGAAAATWPRRERRAPSR